MKELMNFLILSCKKAAILIEKKSEMKLSRKESLQLTLHKSMCGACKSYEKQSTFIDKALHNHEMKEVKTIENATLKNKIISKL